MHSWGTEAQRTLPPRQTGRGRIYRLADQALPVVGPINTFLTAHQLSPSSHLQCHWLRRGNKSFVPKNGAKSRTLDSTRLDCGSNPPRESILYSRSIDAPRLPLKGGNLSPGESRRKEGAATTSSVKEAVKGSHCFLSAGRPRAPIAAGEVQTLAICGRVSRYYGGGGGKLSYGGSVLRRAWCSAQIWGVSGKKRTK